MSQSKQDQSKNQKVVPFPAKSETTQEPLRTTWTVGVKPNQPPLKITQVSSGFGKSRTVMMFDRPQACAA
ncbi:hypothetical protein [Thermoflavimicrobium daqui]|jgi:hypothetical protein|uniref:Uncharacterized protein n=1 Tax=Thermoflavimicrobium daqui TaxID=2137476 RepID=A0A364K2A6_9BACL|nr:hypothetical protein [Thermoflavimicrobium daqui]RAL22550.1 hypothetical protein DL897_14150 [Thermoflavimicrobium daqui]